MAGPLASLVQGKYNKEAAKDAAELAKAQQKAGMQLINELDYEPMYASENVPTFQRSKSPVARSYLESFLAGNNPQATFSGAPNAGLKKARQQGAQDQMFGTIQQRMAQQRAMESATPWKVTPPTRRVNPNRSEEPGAANWTVENAELAASGVNKKLADALASTGTDLPAMKAAAHAKTGFGSGAFSDYSRTGADVEHLLELYGGNADKLADDIRDAGGLDALAKKVKKGRR